MTNGKGRIPTAIDLENKSIEALHGQQKRADTNNDRSGRQMNRNVSGKGRPPLVINAGKK